MKLDEIPTVSSVYITKLGRPTDQRQVDREFQKTCLFSVCLISYITLNKVALSYCTFQDVIFLC